MTSTRARRHSRDGAQFAETLHTLGSEGFADWLVKVYGLQEPKFKLGSFFYDRDLEFSEVFAEVSAEFDFDELEIAVNGVTLASRKLASRRKPVNLFSIFALSRIAASVNAFNAVPELSKLIGSSFVGQDTNSFYVTSLRDTLENILSLVFSCIDQCNALQKGFARLGNADEQRWFGYIANWAWNTLVDDRNEAALVPAYAPLFFLSLLNFWGFLRDGREEEFTEQANAIVRNCFAKYPSWANPLAVFESFHAAGKGTYNLDAILETQRDFIDALRKVNIFSDRDDGILSEQFSFSFKTVTSSGYVRPMNDLDAEDLMEEIYIDLKTA